MANFILNTDYEGVLKSTNLTDLLESNFAILESVENQAISEVETALSERYDTQTLFAQTGTNRHPYVIKLCVNLVLYEIYKRVPHIEIPDYIKEDNAYTRQELILFAKGTKSLANAPRKLNEELNPITVRRFFSLDKRQGN